MRTACLLLAMVLTCALPAEARRCRRRLCCQVPAATTPFIPATAPSHGVESNVQDERDRAAAAILALDKSMQQAEAARRRAEELQRAAVETQNRAEQAAQAEQLAKQAAVEAREKAEAVANAERKARLKATEQRDKEREARLLAEKRAQEAEAALKVVRDELQALKAAAANR